VGEWAKKLRKLFEDMMKNLFLTTSMPGVSEKKRDVYHLFLIGENLTSHPKTLIEKTR
jgi:hypothetical protein